MVFWFLTLTSFVLEQNADIGTSKCFDISIQDNYRISSQMTKFKEYLESYNLTAFMEYPQMYLCKMPQILVPVNCSSILK